MANDTATKKDIERVENHIADLTAIVQKSFEVVHADTQGVRNELKEDMHNVKIEVLESNEKIVKEVSDMRAEQTAIVGGRERVDDTLLVHGDTLADHERRLGVLETSTP